MLGWLGKRHRELKQSARLEAERLIAAQGQRAWETIYEKCRGECACRKERAMAYRVRRIVERRLKMSWRHETPSADRQADTTRLSL